MNSFSSAPASLKRRIRRFVNKLGIDIVQFDVNRMASDAEVFGPKPNPPERIVIGGGDYVYGRKWHNIEYVTSGYADKYKSLPRNIDIAHDLTSGRPFPLRDGSILAAYTSHVIEHLKDDHVSHVFRDTWRVLKPGGVFRISCPDIDLYVRAFRDQDLEFFHYRNHPHYRKLGIADSVVGLFLDVFATQLGERSPAYTYADVKKSMDEMGVDRAVEYYCAQVQYEYSKSHYHVNWFNFAKLNNMLKAAGFTSVYRSAIGQSVCPDLRDLSKFDSGDPKISLFVECTK